MTLGFLSAFGDAFQFIVDGQASLTTGGREVGGPQQCWDRTKTHLEATFLALGASLLVALPPGLLLGHLGRGETFAVAFGNAGRAVPELALIAFFFAFLGSGMLPLVLALMVLGIPPLLTNAFVGMRQVDRGAVEAARGMGMSELGIILKVELPLAVATIMSGVRTATINIVATATIGPLIGVLTLGDFILNRNVYGDAGVLAGAILVALLAVILELALAGIQSLLTPRGTKVAAAAGDVPTRWWRRETTRA
jgi:osmoprotectant transport system permease protein